ncbi:MAG: SpoIIE family protein phosphatase [bacterium]
MKYFDDHPNHFRFFLVAVAVFFVGLAGLNFHRYASQMTDENLFRTSDATILISRDLPGERSQRGAVAQDTVQAGDLLLEINDRAIETAQEAQAYMLAQGRAAEIELKVFRPTSDSLLFFRVPRAALPDSFLVQLPPSVFVIQVLEGGASDRAGLRTGDLILRINGQNFGDAREADRIMRGAHSHRAIAYDILRGPHFMTLHLQLARLGTNIAGPVGVVCGLIFLGVALFVGLQRPQLLAARLVALTLLAFSFPVMVLYQRHFIVDEWTIAIRFTLASCLLFGTACGLHQSLYFPKERPELIRKRWPIFAPYLLAGFWFVLQILLQFYISEQVTGIPFLFGIISLGIYGLFMFLRYRKQSSAEYQKLNQIIKTAVLVATGLVFAISLPVALGRQDTTRLGFTGLPLSLIPLSYLYTIGRYRLLNLNLRIRRNIQYTITSWLWGGLLTTVFLFLLFKLPKVPFSFPHFRLTGTYLEVVEAPLPAERREALEKIVMIGLAFGIFYALRSMNRAGQLFIARKFYRTSYDYRRAVNEMAEVMATKLGMVELAKGLAQKLAEHIQIKRVGVLFFRDQKECCCMEGYGFERDEWKEFCLAVDRELIHVLQKFRSESRFSVDYLPNDMKAEFERQGFAHLFPIRFKEKLVGALLVGEKLSEASFLVEELNYLAAVSKQASLAIENAFLYEELAEQERLKHELAIARRIQLASLPQVTPRIEGLEIAGVSIPAMEVGGDYFDYLNGAPSLAALSSSKPARGPAEQITIIVGDVSGKGTSAALYMSKVQGILRSLHDFGLSPRELFVRANHLLRQAMERTSFVTSIGARFEPHARRMHLARAGHLPLFYYSAQHGHVEKITPKGLGMGLDDEKLFAAELEEKKLNYDCGDVFLFVTDGITEAQNGTGSEFGEESVSEILSRHSTASAEKIRDHIIAAVKLFAQNTQQHDDLTVVVVKAK